MANVNKNFWREFIALYRELPELWKVKSTKYRNRNMKSLAYEKLVEKMREIDPKADRALVRTKINALRTSYRRELKKLDTNKKSGAGDEDVYVPTLWYFSDIDFLREQESQAENNSTDGIEADEEVEETNESGFEGESFHLPTKKKTTEKRKAVLEDMEAKRCRLLDIACERLQSPASESHIISKGWRNEFAKLKPDQQLFAKKFIDDILFEGRLGNLHRNSVIINHSCTPSPIYQEIPHSSHQPLPHKAPHSP